MILTGGNYGLYYQAWQKGAHVLWRNTEFKAYLLIIAVAAALIGICDRQPEREAACLQKLEAHVRLFYRTFQADRNERSEDDEP